MSDSDREEPPAKKAAPKKAPAKKPSAPEAKEETTRRKPPARTVAPAKPPPPADAAPADAPPSDGPPPEAPVEGAPARRGAAARALVWLRTRSTRVKTSLAALAVLILVVLVAALAGNNAPLRAGGGTAAPAQADAVPYDGRSPRAPAGDEQRVLVALPRPALGELPGAREMSPEDQRAYVASLKREAGALRSALDARGVRLRDVVSFERTFNGFAATVRTRQLADLASLGVRPQPVRRLYPALGEPVPAPAAGEASQSRRRWKVAVLAGGVQRRDGVSGGYDAVDRDRDPRPGEDPRRGSRTEASGDALAGVLADAGARVTPIRIAALRPDPDLPAPEELATTDTLLAGLEHTVDPDGDGATDDHIPVALVGVNAPYAGFARSAEARAGRGAAGLGTLVVAGAGQEGAAAPGSGTIGAPAAGKDVLAVGALAAPDTSHVALTVGDVRTRAALLGGRPPRTSLRTAGPLDTADLTQLLRPGASPLQGRLVIVRAGDNPPARAAAAAAAGARTVLLAEPSKRALATMPAGRVGVPVIGVTGEAAEKVLREKAGAEAAIGRVESARETAPAAQLSQFSSRGPAASGAPKPDLVAPGAALVAQPDGTAELVGGTAVAAARVAVAASRLSVLHPELPTPELRIMLASAADPAGLPVAGAGAGVLRPDPVLPGLVVRPARPARFAVSNDAGTPLSIRLSAESGRTTPSTLDLQPGDAQSVTVTPSAAPPPGGHALGRLLVSSSTGGLAGSFPWAVPGGEADPVPVGRLELERGPDDRVRGVRFAVGLFERGDPLEGEGTRIVLANSLELVLMKGKSVVRRLTPPGGARELLPAEYAYTLQESVLRSLGDGTYRFRATARAPRQRRATVVLSQPFQP